MTHDVVDRLRRFVEAVATEAQVPVGHVEWPLGLSVVGCPETFRYEMTPRPSSTFAVTGGNGVHFVHLADVANGLVVMVSPAAFMHHVVLGESVEDFLRLGYYDGFEWVEDLAYPEAGDACRHYTDTRTPRPPLGPQVIRSLRDEFALAPIDDVGGHLENLRRHHLAAVSQRAQRRSAS